MKDIADFTNGRQCAKNFGNAIDSKLTAGGAYVTAETKTSFKGYYRVSAKKDAVLIRSFVQFDGEGETANARQREIGGHAAELLRNVCLRNDPHSPYADREGYVPFGNLVDYAGGRSDGCTSWSPSDAGQIIAMVKDNPTTLYIYPDSADIDAVAKAVETGQSLSRAGVYWNASCLKEIGSPKFWPKETLEPILAQYKKDHPAAPQRPSVTPAQQVRRPQEETLLLPRVKVSTPATAKECDDDVKLRHTSINKCRRLGLKQTYRGHCNSVTIDP